MESKAVSQGEVGSLTALRAVKDRRGKCDTPTSAIGGAYQGDGTTCAGINCP